MLVVVRFRSKANAASGGDSGAGAVLRNEEVGLSKMGFMMAAS